MLVVALVFILLYLVRGVLLPFIVGGFIAILLEPIIRQLRKRGLSRGVAISAVFAVFLAVVLGAAVITVPIMSRQFIGLSNRISGVTRQIAAQSYANNYFLRWNPKHRVAMSSQVAPLDESLAPFRPTLERYGVPSTQAEIVKRYVDPRRSEINGLVQAFFGSFLGALAGFGTTMALLLFAPLVAFFLLMDMDRIRANLPKLVPPSIRPQTLSVVQDVGTVFQDYLRGVTTSWTLYAITMGGILMVFEVPYSILLALFFATCYFIPKLGDIVNGTVLFLVIVATGTSSNWFLNVPSPWMFALIVIAIQFIMTMVWDFMLMPNLVGSAVGLRPAASLFAVMCMASLFGFVGMLLAFPAGGAIQIVLGRLMRATTKIGSDSLGLPAVPLRHRAPLDS